MKFLVIARPRDGVHEPGTAAEARAALARLREYEAAGVLEQAYWLLGGGSAWVVNVESASALANGLQGTHLVRHSDLEIHDIEDAVDYLEGRARTLEAAAVAGDVDG